MYNVTNAVHIQPGVQFSKAVIEFFIAFANCTATRSNGKAQTTGIIQHHSTALLNTMLIRSIIMLIFFSREVKIFLMYITMLFIQFGSAK